MSDDLLEAVRCMALGRKAMFRLKQLGRILDSLIPDYVPRLFSTRIKPHLEVNIQTYPSILRRDRNMIKKFTGGL